nr:ferredoxin [Nocardioides convexus]
MRGDGPRGVRAWTTTTSSRLHAEKTTDENIDDVKRAVAACPRAAISLVEE